MSYSRMPFVAATIAAFLGAAATTTTVHAQQADAASADHVLGQHPAVLVKRQAQQPVDTNRLILAHPAGLFVIDTPTPTYDHPAVIVARRSHEPSEMDRYLAEPPVASAWLRRSELSAATAGGANAH